MFLRELRTPDDDSAVARLWSSVSGEPISEATLAAWAKLKPEVKRLRCGAFVDDVLVGFAAASALQQVCAFRVIVEPRARGRGVGRALFERVEAFARETDAVAVEAHARSEEAVRFALSRGLAVASRKVLCEFDLSREPPVVHAPASVRITTLHETRNEDALLAATSRLDDGFSWDRAHFDAHVAPYPSLQAIALVGDEIVGYALTQPIPHTTFAGSTGTVVHRAHRRRGIARALKARVLRECRAAGYARVAADNEEGPMLAINESLGYVRTGIEIVLRKDL